MTFEETLNYLYEKLPMFQRVGKSAFKKNLDNTIAFCRHLGNPQNKFKSVHIAGTNGKGSSAHMIASVLQEAGYKTGLYTSPHLYRFTERIRVDGREAEPGFIVDFVAKNKKVIEKIRPSFFELTVAMTFEYFARKKVEIAVVETGLGGRLDSTNIITPAVSLITNISFDHTDILGDTLAEIAYEKAGIIKKNVPVVISEFQKEAAQVFRNKASTEKAPLYFAGETVQVLNIRGRGPAHTLVDVQCNTWGMLRDLRLDSAGIYQVKNLPGVIKVLEILNSRGLEIGERHLREGLARIKKNTGFWGRWEILSAAPLMICDTAHNAAGVRAMANQLDELEYRQLHIVWGMVNGKGVEEIMKLLPGDARYYFCQARIPRAMDAVKLASGAEKAGRKGAVYGDVNEAIRAAMVHAEKEDAILIGGSNFVVAEINRDLYEKETSQV